MRKFLFFAVASMMLGVFAIAAEKNAVQPENKQGITGIVLQITGNHMPGPDRKANDGTPMSVPVHIFKDKVKPYDGPAKGNPAYLCTVNSDKEGKFKVALVPGRYTVVIEHKGKLYLNGYDGFGFWNSVEVKENTWTNVKIVESSSAVF